MSSKRSGVSSRVKVPYVDFPGQFRRERARLLPALTRVLSSGRFILGEEVEVFEREFSALCGVRHAVGLANGTDAITLTLKAAGIGPGDEVITAPNSFVATAGGIVQAGARPVFADVGEDQNLDPAAVERAVTKRTRAIMPVHLGGKPCDMKALEAVAARRGLSIIEDAAQSVGAEFAGRRTGSFGRAACFSLHPLKNLNAVGDAGIVTTNDDGIASALRLLRNHGLETRDESAIFGFNSRLDALQAAVLRVRMKSLEKVTRLRRAFAARYRKGLGGVVTCPSDPRRGRHVYHVFVIQTDRRDELQAFLLARGIETKVHYPIPIHLMKAGRALGYGPGDFPVAERQAKRILSLPVHQFLRESQVDFVIREIRRFFGRRI